ncbi:tetratricopeptide repeat protein (plasmid) [Sorangium sp. So ce119]|uniref:tetratricopeptide repeat protein n=1 Tax=Sorangium sp. So ce119 TaxID=3133279 RepID=UPI003F611488
MNVDCRSELLTRVRRGVATEPDRRAFDAHLGACASCRMSWVLAQDFDAVGAAEPGDAELLARIASVAIGRAGGGGAPDDVPRTDRPVWPVGDTPALREGAPVWPESALALREGAPALREGAPVWPESAPVRPDNDVRRGDDVAPPGSGMAGRYKAGWRRSAWLYAAAAVLLCGVAAAATALVERPAPGPSARRVEPSLRAVVSRARPPAPSAAAPSEAAPPAPDGAPAPGGAALPELAAPAPRPPEAARGPGAEAARGPGAAASSTAASTAEQLFREANDARRAGSTQRAIELYRALQKRFAGSPEATLSLVSLGGLLLNGGSAAAALAQFDRYLGVAGARPLAVEALYGRGRALRALGRSGDEAQTWRRLLREHPSSPYAEHARRRLAELGG